MEVLFTGAILIEALTEYGKTIVEMKIKQKEFFN